jgi:hypothetical protein
MDAFFSLSEEEIKANYPGVYGKPHNYLAISGGGAPMAPFLQAFSLDGLKQERDRTLLPSPA